MSSKNKLNNLKKEIKNCSKCKLTNTRTNVVFGEGNPNADIMLIGEGPGGQEDEQGRPFVGRAGEILTSIIENSIYKPRSDVFIANIVKCRPTVDMMMKKDRPPDQDEIDACTQYLLEQIKIIKPKVIVTLGNPSTKFILKTKTGITKIRGTWGKFDEIPVLPTYHPGYILRNGGVKSQLWKDAVKDIIKVKSYIVEIS